MSTWLSHTWTDIWSLFCVCLWGSFWVSLTFKSVDWVKQKWVGLAQSVEGLKREKADLPLSKTAFLLPDYLQIRTSAFLPSDSNWNIGSSWPQAYQPSDGSHAWVLRPSDLDGNCWVSNVTTDSADLGTCYLHNCVNCSFHIEKAIGNHPIGSISLENPDIYGCTTICLSTHFLWDIWVVWVWAITNETSVNICAQVFSWMYVFSSHK